MEQVFSWQNVGMALKNVPRLLREMRRAGPLWVIGITLIMLLQGLIPPAILLLTRELVDSLATGGTAGAGLLMVLVAVAVGTGHLLNDLRTAIMSVIGRRLSTDLKLAVLEKALNLEQVELEKSRNQDLLHNANQAASSGIAIYVLGSTMGTVREAITLAGLIALLATVHWSLPFLVIGASFPTLIIGMRFGGERFQVLRAQAGRVRVVSYIGRLLTNPVEAKEVRTHALGDALKGRWYRMAMVLADEEAKVQWRRSIAGLAGQTVSVAGYVAALLIIMAGVSRGDISLGALAATIFAVSQAYGHVEGVVNNLAEIFTHSLTARNLFEWLDLPVSHPARKAGGLPAPALLAGGIRFEQVRFGYPTSPQPVLDGITLDFRPGERVALVGENGAGKSTLVKLLSGLYTPDSGRVLVDGTDLQAMDRESWRDRISVCFQDFVRFQLTAGENISLGRPALADDRERIAAAAEATGASVVVDSLPQGYESLVGSELGGKELSGGQWQKLAVARAFFRDAPVLVLDEPTAALDPKAEAELFDLFSELAQGKICLFISHRMGMARRADRIIVLRDGRIAEEGTHEALLARGGEYSRMYALQAKWYQ